MRTFVASLATVLALSFFVVVAGCGGDGAEPDAPTGGAQPAAGPDQLDLVLDFQPNAVHSGIYAAQEDGFFADRGVEIEIRAPGASTDAPKLLRAGRADLAILDIHDLAIAREQGVELIGIAAIVQEPLAAVIAGDGQQIREPADLHGTKVGVTGLPSDDAVLESVLASADLAIDDVDVVTIGFEAVPSLLSGQLDAATAFWNAEGVTLAERLPTREFRVADFGAPPYPELVLVTTPETLEERREAIEGAVAAIDGGYAEVVADPAHGLDALLGAVPELDREQQQAQLEAVLPAFGEDRSLDRETIGRWSAWDARHGIVEEAPDPDETFDFEVAKPAG